MSISLRAQLQDAVRKGILPKVDPAPQRRYDRKKHGRTPTTQEGRRERDARQTQTTGRRPAAPCGPQEDALKKAPKKTPQAAPAQPAASKKVAKKTRKVYDKKDLQGPRGYSGEPVRIRSPQEIAANHAARAVRRASPRVPWGQPIYNVNDTDDETSSSPHLILIPMGGINPRH